MKKYLPWIIAILALTGFIYLLFQPSDTSSLNSESVPDLGRDHIPVGQTVDYNSNPPTSGPHYEEWTRAGIYDEPIDDGYLIHSLEHGYVIISYNCDKLSFSLIPSAYAHDGEDHSNEATGAATTNTKELSTECESLVKKLSDLANNLQLSKLIVVPRNNLDTTLALTAWNKIDKFNEYDEERITSFVNAYRNKGPEQTLE